LPAAICRDLLLATTPLSIFELGRGRSGQRTILVQLQQMFSSGSAVPD
jgi:hypothetical protein